MLFTIAVLSYIPLTMLAPSTPTAPTLAAVTTQQPAAAAQLNWPSYGEGAIGMVGRSSLLAQHGDTGQHPIASITKLVTAMVVLSAKPLKSGEEGPTLTMTSRDASYYGRYLALNGDVLPVSVGQKLTEHQVLQLMLIRSANNYATTLAVWAFGSESGYLDAANAWLGTQGLGEVTITDPTGIQPSNTAATADLVHLGELAMANPVVAEVVGSSSATVAGVGTISSTNELLGTNGIDGIKTGTLDQAGACLLFTLNWNLDGQQVRLVGVMLGGPGPRHDRLDADILTLLASVKRNLHSVVLAIQGHRVAQYVTAWGQRVDAVTTAQASAVLWGDERVSETATLRKVLPSTSGTKVGTLAFSTPGGEVSVPVVLASAITDPGPIWKFGHPFDLLH